MFGRKPKPRIDLSSVRRKGDRKILEALLEHGDDLSRRRHTLLFFYRIEGDERTDEEAFGALISAGEKLGLSIYSQRDGALILEGQKLVDPDNVNALTEWAEQQAARAGVEFDGWECAVEEQKPN